MNRTELLTARATKYTEAAADAFEAGFASEAARKRALDAVNTAYDALREGAHDATIAAAPTEDQAARVAHFDANDFPFGLHQVRDRHLAIFAKWGNAQAVRSLIDLRAAIKAAAVAPAPMKDAAAEKVEAVRKSIIDIMETRKAQFIEAVEIGRLFNGLPVTVNAHYVHGHKGARFVRHFFYLRGRLTPLNIIMAAAQTLKDEKAGA